MKIIFDLQIYFLFPNFFICGMNLSESIKSEYADLYQHQSEV